MVDPNLRNKILRANVELSSSKQFALISGLLLTIKHEISEDVPTAHTTGKKVVWGAGFLKKLTPKETAWVAAHEVAHVLFMHPRKNLSHLKENKQKAGIVADEVVNNFLLECDPSEQLIAPPSWFPIVRTPKYRGMSFMEIWNDIGKNGYGDSGKDIEDYQTIDIHDFVDFSNEEMTEIEVATGIGKHRAQAMGRKADFNKPEEVNWKELLSQWITRSVYAGGERTWVKPNRRFAWQGVYFPSSASKTAKSAVIAIDVSGSISQDMLADFLGHTKAICESVRIQTLHIMYWDVGVQRHETIDLVTSEKLEQTRPCGGGGTVFAPVLDYIEEQNITPAFMITMTDGYISEWGEQPQFPHIWVINSDVKPEYGIAIHVK